MDDYTIHDIQVQDVQTLGSTGAAVRNKQVTFFVGAHGPFIRVYAPNEYAPARVTADMAAEVDALKAIGATSSPAGGY